MKLKLKCFGFVLLSIFVACKRLDSVDYSLSKDCKEFYKYLGDTLENRYDEGLHYVFVDTAECILTLKFEKEKVNADEVMDYLMVKKLHFIEMKEEDYLEIIE